MSKQQNEIANLKVRLQEQKDIVAKSSHTDKILDAIELQQIADYLTKMDGFTVIPDSMTDEEIFEKLTIEEDSLMSALEKEGYISMKREGVHDAFVYIQDGTCQSLNDSSLSLTIYELIKRMGSGKLNELLLAL